MFTIFTKFFVIGVRQQVVNSVYKKCATIAKDYISRHISQWQLGGPDVIVIIDIYPEGCKKFNMDDCVAPEGIITPIICFAEAKVYS